jgi:hypothetical protein
LKAAKRARGYLLVDTTSWLPEQPNFDFTQRNYFCQPQSRLEVRLTGNERGELVGVFGRTPGSRANALTWDGTCPPPGGAGHKKCSIAKGVEHQA